MRLIRRLRGACLGICLAVATPGAIAFDAERAFSNYDRLVSGEIGAGELSGEERAEVMIIQNTFDQLDRSDENALEWTDCHAARTMARQQSAQLGAMSARLASCARRFDRSSLLSAADSLTHCARSGGSTDSCNSRARRVESLRDDARPCLSELRSALREQRHLASIESRRAQMCVAGPNL